jgi:hypothetical protein
MKTLSRNAAAIAVTAGIITQGQLLWLFGAICLLGLAVLAFVVCSKDGDRRVARFERVVYAFKSHLRAIHLSRLRFVRAHRARVVWRGGGPS